jgi:hypothetical protein
MGAHFAECSGQPGIEACESESELPGQPLHGAILYRY